MTDSPLFTMRRRVAFAETDMAGILHFANYFRYMEEVEHAFFRSLGMRVHEHDGEQGFRGWVRGDVQCRYLHPLRYEQVVDLHLRVARKGTKSITYEIDFLLPGTDGQPVHCARGTVVAVCVTQGPGDSRPRAIPIPAEVDARIDAAPA